MNRQKAVIFIFSLIQSIVLCLIVLGYANNYGVFALVLFIVLMLLGLFKGIFSSVVYVGTYQLPDSENNFCIVRVVNGFFVPMLPFSGLTGVGSDIRLLKNVPSPNPSFMMLYERHFLDSFGINCFKIKRSECRKICKSPQLAKEYFTCEPIVNKKVFISDTEPFVQAGLLEIVYISSMFSLFKMPNGLYGISMYKKEGGKQIGFYITEEIAEKIIKDEKDFLKNLSGLSNENVFEGIIVFDESLYVSFASTKQQQTVDAVQAELTPQSVDNRKILTHQHITESLKSNAEISLGTRLILVFAVVCTVMCSLISFVDGISWLSLLFVPVICIAVIVFLLDKRKITQKRKQTLQEKFYIEEVVCEGREYSPSTDSPDNYTVYFNNGVVFDDRDLYNRVKVGTVGYIVCYYNPDQKLKYYFLDAKFWKLAPELEPLVRRRFK